MDNEQIDKELSPERIKILLDEATRTQNERYTRPEQNQFSIQITLQETNFTA